MPAPPNAVAHKPHFHRNTAWKQPVRVATTGALSVASGLESGDTVDGITLATGDRVLVKDQVDAAQNGIYVVQTSGAAERAYDMDVAAEVVGALVPVLEGTQAGTLWRCTTTTEPTLETDDIDFAPMAVHADAIEVADAGAYFTSTTGEAVLQELGNGSADALMVVLDPAGATEELDCTVARNYELHLEEDTTLTLTGAVNGRADRIRLFIYQDNIGGWTITWPDDVYWPGDTEPTLDTGAWDADIIVLRTTDGGTTWLGIHEGAGYNLPAPGGGGGAYWPFLALTSS
jgi:hypothetical protein